MSHHNGFSPVERAIKEAMREGLFDNLPGTGKPLKMFSEEDPNTPEDMRLAYKIMKDNDIVPDWMMLGDVLTQQQEKIRHELARGLRAYRGALHDADRDGDLGKRHRANITWERLLGMFEELVQQYNHNILTYNLKVPHGVKKRHYMTIEAEIEKLGAKR